MSKPIRTVDAQTPFSITRRGLLAAHRSRKDADGRLAKRFRTGPRVEWLEDRMLLTNFSVNSNADTNSGTGTTGTLRYVLNQLNSTGGSSNTISFGSLPSNQFTFTPGSPLPNIANPVTIDGSTASGFSSAPLITIAGGSAGSGANGLTFGTGSSGSTVKDLAIGGFASGNGIDILSGSTGDGVAGCWLGINASGTTNANHIGVLVSGTNATVGGTATGNTNVISGNTYRGIDVEASCLVEGNRIGTNAAGTAAIANLNGIRIGASGATIGGTTANAMNVVSGNTDEGINIWASSLVEGNLIGTNAAGTAAIANGDNGVDVETSGSGTTIGGTTAAANVISGNTNDGIEIEASCLVEGNLIGTNGAGTAPVANATGIHVGVSGATIGGAAAGDANTISGNTGYGLNMSAPCTVLGNFIGTNAAGATTVRNHDGILVQATATGATIGGTASGDANTIGNGYYGIRLLAASCTVVGNYIGTDAAGDALPNKFGVWAAAAGEMIGGTASGDANTISGNKLYGIFLNGEACTVAGNWIGTNSAGAILPNGVGIGEVAPFATIGGTTSGAGNTISGNGTGINIQTPLATVEGNWIGTNSAGATVPNTTGILVSTPQATIGGTAPGAGNTISGNGTGIELDADCPVVGNWIGTNASGDTVANGTGILVNVPGATIGGTTSGDANTISGNSNDGIDIDAASCTVVGNWIGTNAAGDAIANKDGIYIESSATGATIGGTDSGAANLISGNSSDGIYANASCLIEGNLIGTNAAGTAKLANSQFGVDVEASGVTIGGLTATAGTAPGNVISGNAKSGIYANASCLIEGNLIGTNAAGTAVVSNGSSFVPGNDGVDVYASGVTVGGTAAGSANVISSNWYCGILARASCLVEGNLIGTNAAGNPELLFGQDIGVEVDTTGVTVGGTAAGAGNLISGNTYTGINVFASCLIEGNLIGTNAAGTAAVPNITGIYATAAGATIGGTTAGAGNVISGNSGVGLYVAASCLIEGNWVGTNAAGAALPNNIGIEAAAPGATIGGSAGAGNVIAFNQGAGVATTPGTISTTIRYNAISGNGGPGIDLSDDGVTPNMPGGILNTPIITTSGGGIISGTLDAAPNATYIIDVYANLGSDDSAARPQGRYFLATTTVTTDLAGHAAFSVFTLYPGPQILTATSTTANGTTSEFSPPVGSPLTATGTTFAATAGVALQGTVANFTTTDSTATKADFAATIHWGDGTPDSSGTIMASPGGFVVVGTHTYAAAGTYPISVTINDTVSGATVTADSTATVATSSLTATGLSFAAMTGVALQGTVASFTTTDPTATAGDFAATIAWGDGTANSTGTIVASPGGFVVVGTHTYTTANPVTPVTVTINDTLTGSQAAANSLADVAGPGGVLTTYGQTANFVAGTPYAATLVGFTDSNPNAIASQFTAVITWGDGTSGPGTVSASGAGFVVTGTHTYNYASPSQPGASVAITDRLTGLAATASPNVVVAPVPLTIMPKNFAVTPGTAFSGTVATFTDSNPLTSAGFYTATINWGDGSSTTTGTITGSNPFTVSSSHTYQAAALAVQGTAIVTITITDANGQTATAVARAVDPPVVPSDPTVSGPGASSTPAYPTVPPTVTPPSAASTVALAMSTGNLIVSPNGSFHGIVASFADGGPTETAGAYKATIDWGKGRRSAGMVTGSNGRFVVSAKHVFPRFTGTKIVTVSVTDPEGQTVSVNESATEASGHRKVMKVSRSGKSGVAPHR